MNGRVLGIDYGERRIGLALSDPMRIIGSGHSTYQRESLALDIKYLAELIEREEVVEIVMGLPCHANGDEGDMAQRARAFADALIELCPRPLHFVDETYSSLEADEVLRRKFKKDWRKRKEQVDMIAAQIILTNFINA